MYSSQYRCKRKPWSKYAVRTLTPDIWHLLVRRSWWPGGRMTMSILWPSPQFCGRGRQLKDWQYYRPDFYQALTNKQLKLSDQGRQSCFACLLSYEWESYCDENISFINPGRMRVKVWCGENSRRGAARAGAEYSASAGLFCVVACVVWCSAALSSLHCQCHRGHRPCSVQPCSLGFLNFDIDTVIHKQYTISFASFGPLLKPPLYPLVLSHFWNVHF